MTTTAAFDPVAFKASQRAEWDSAAPGWDTWFRVLEAEAAGRAQTRALLDLARLGPGDTVLDVATGYGEPGLTAARVVGPAGRVVCSDISAGMLALVRRRAREAGLANVELVEGDAEALAFDAETFDAILCRHGLQFFADVGGALRRFRSWLKHDGRLAAIVWGPPAEVPFARAVPVILGELQLPPPPAGRPGIFALSDADALAEAVEAAGFREVETGPVTVVYEADSPEDWTQLIRAISPPIANLVAGQPPDVAERVWGKVTEAWAPFATPKGGVRFECQAIQVAGTR